MGHRRHWEGRTDVALRVRVAVFGGGFISLYPMDSHNPFELPMRDETYTLLSLGRKKLSNTPALSGER